MACNLLHERHAELTRHSRRPRTPESRRSPRRDPLARSARAHMHRDPAALLASDPKERRADRCRTAALRSGVRVDRSQPIQCWRALLCGRRARVACAALRPRPRPIRVHAGACPGSDLDVVRVRISALRRCFFAVALSIRVAARRDPVSFAEHAGRSWIVLRRLRIARLGTHGSWRRRVLRMGRPDAARRVDRRRAARRCRGAGSVFSTAPIQG